MIIFCNFFLAVGTVLGMLLNMYIWIMVIRALLSWVNPDPGNFIVQFLNAITEPILEPVRRRMPRTGMIDLSILVVILGIYFVNILVAQSLIDYGKVCKNEVILGS